METGRVCGEDRARELLRNVYPEMKRVAGHAITPIIELHSASEGELRGSGFLVTSGGRTCLATAAHVLQISRGLACLLAGTIPTQIQGTVYCSGSPIDVAAIDLSELIPTASDLSEKVTPLSEELLDRDNAIRPDIFYMCGFPQRMSRFTAFMPGVLGEVLPFATTLGSSTSIRCYDPDLHFLIEYPEASESEQGKTVELPDPHGLSGSPVWNTRAIEIGGSWTGDDARVVGVAQAWDPDGKVLICTKIEHVNRQISLALSGLATAGRGIELR